MNTFLVVDVEDAAADDAIIPMRQLERSARDAGVLGRDAPLGMNGQQPLEIAPRLVQAPYIGLQPC